MSDRARRFEPSRLKQLKPRAISETYWHQGPVRRPLRSFASPAAGDGRYHRAGGPGAWYASSKERAAWAELLRHHQSRQLSPLEIRRRVGRVSVEALAVLDLTDDGVRGHLRVDIQALIGDDRGICQAVAEAARAAGFEGILAPSAAMEDEMTLVVFPVGMRKVREQHSRVQRPPRSLLKLLDTVRISGRARRRLLRLARTFKG